MIINPEESFKYWLAKAEEDIKSAKTMLESSHYTWCAFIGQQAIEKILKALYIKQIQKIPPYIHKLERLVELLKIELPTGLMQNLIHIDKYYIATRYPSYVIKLNIENKKKCQDMFQKTKEIYQWLKKKI